MHTPWHPHQTYLCQPRRNPSQVLRPGFAAASAAACSARLVLWAETQGPQSVWIWGEWMVQVGLVSLLNVSRQLWKITAFHGKAHLFNSKLLLVYCQRVVSLAMWARPCHAYHTWPGMVNIPPMKSDDWGMARGNNPIKSGSKSSKTKFGKVPQCQ